MGFLLKMRPEFAWDSRFILLPPQTMNPVLLANEHNDPTAGHSHTFTTMETLQLPFFWPKM